MGHEEHRHRAPSVIGIALVTVSDTHTASDDESGRLARQQIEAAGHLVRDYRVLKDEPEAVMAAVRELSRRKDLRAIILNGGTGISRRDRTYEAVSVLLERRIEGFGEIFRSLSFEEIGPAAILSRAVAGLVGDKAVFSVPGSPAAVRLALEKLILPELGHIVAEIDKEPAGGKRVRVEGFGRSPKASRGSPADP